MTIASRVLARLLELPPADTYDVLVQRDLEVPMPDGVKLLADHYAPRGAGKLPTLLVRSPYGRRAFFGLQFGTHGPSYLGLVQWALAAEAGPALKAMVAHETAVPADQSVFHDPAHPSALVLPVMA